MHISTTNSEGVGINIPDIPNGHLSLKWKNGLPDLEPFLHTENLMYPVLESPRYACHLWHLILKSFIAETKLDAICNLYVW